MINNFKTNIKIHVIKQIFYCYIIEIALSRLCELNVSYYLNICTYIIICSCVVILTIIEKDKILPIDQSIYTLVPQSTKIFFYNVPYTVRKDCENVGAIIVIIIYTVIYQLTTFLIITLNVPYIFGKVYEIVGAIIVNIMSKKQHTFLYIFINHVPNYLCLIHYSDALDKESAVVTSQLYKKLIYSYNQVLYVIFFIFLLILLEIILAIFSSLSNKQMCCLVKLTYLFETENNLSATIASLKYLLCNVFVKSTHNHKCMQCNCNCQSLKITNNMCVGHPFYLSQLQNKYAK